MTAATQSADGDWAMPATRAEIMLLKADLGGKIKDVEGKIKDVRVEMANMGRALDSKVDNLRVDLSGEVAKLRVSMAWMTVGVATVLGGLMTLFEFLS